jgi:hypothetical protein
VKVTARQRILTHALEHVIQTNQAVIIPVNRHTVTSTAIAIFAVALMSMVMTPVLKTIMSV